PSARRNYCWPNRPPCPSRCSVASMLKQIANAALFQAGWFACVIGGDSYWLLIPLGVLLAHLLWISSWAAEGKLLLWITGLGTLLDSALLMLGDRKSVV